MSMATTQASGPAGEPRELAGTTTNATGPEAAQGGLDANVSIWSGLLIPEPQTPDGRGGPDLLEEARILLVEDDEPTAAVLAEALQASGCQVTTCGDGRQACARLEEGFDVVVTDVVLPGCSGLEVLRQCRQTTPLTRVIVISGENDMQMVVECMRGGASDFLAKPIKLPELTGTVVSALEKRRLAETAHLHRLAHDLLDVRDADRLAERIVHLSGQALEAEGAALFLRDGSGGFRLVRSWGTVPADHPPEWRAFVATIDGQATLPPGDAGDPVIVQARHLLCPLVGRDGIYGMLWLARSDDGRPFLARDIERMRLLTRQIVLAFENADRVQRLLCADRMLTVGELTASVTHEINNALAFMLSNIHYVAEEVGTLRGALSEPNPNAALLAWRERLGAAGLEDLADAAREAAEGAERIVEVVREMRLLSRVQAGDETTIEIESCVDSALRVVHSALHPKVTVEKDEGVSGTVRGIPGLLSQVFVNLFLNASQAMEMSHVGGEVRVRISSEDGDVVVRVHDDGPGIPPEIRDRIFEPFLSTKPAGKGTGLGLSISREIAERHGGRLTVECGDGPGTTFVLRLPSPPAEEA